MKIRNGFVSNSSSSSFVVKIKEFDYTNNKMIVFLTEEEITLLENYGFKKTEQSYPSKIDVTGIKPNSSGENLAYKVVCNQDEVISFLVENNIPFIASIHYGNSTIFFEILREMKASSKNDDFTDT